MLKQQIQNDTTIALKGQDSFVAGTLRMVLAAVLTKEKDKKFKEKVEGDVVLSDDEIIEVITSEIKKRRDAIALYNQGNRPELSKKEEDEIKVLQKYLPEQLSQDDIKKIVTESIAKVGAKEMKDMGKVMADLSPRVKGRAEGSKVSGIVKELLSK